MSAATDPGTFESLWRLWREWRAERTPPPGAVMEVSHHETGVRGSACRDSDNRRDPTAWVEFHGRTAGEVLNQAVTLWPDHCFEVLVAATDKREAP